MFSATGNRAGRGTIYLKTRIFVGAAALVLMGGSCGVIAPASWAQQAQTTSENPADWTTLRPSFASRLNHLEGVLKGKRTLRVTAFAPSSPHARFPVLGRSNKVAQLRLDNEPIDEAFTNMPHEFSWNTRDFTDGTHVLTIMLLDTVTRETETLDRVVVTLGNNRESDSTISPTVRPEPAPVPEPLPVAPAPKRGGLASRGGASRDFDRGDFARLSTNAAKTADAAAPDKKQGDFGAANSVAPSAALVVEATKSDRPLMATATALCKANGMLYMGLKTGGIAVCNPKTLTGWAVRPSAAVSSAAPKALCADGSGNVYWLASGAGKTLAPTLFSWNAQTKKVASVPLGTALPSGANVTLAAEGKNVLVQTRKGPNVRETSAAFLVNPQTGMVQPQEISLGAGDDNAQAEAAEDPAARLDFSPRYAPDQIMAIASANGKSVNRWRQVGPDIVAQMDETGDGAYAYLPWNGAAKDGKIVAALSDETGVWIATEKGGVRHITPGSPNEENGYDGYVRAHLTDAAEFTQDSSPSAERNEKIAAVVEEWQGTPYLWGGATKKGTDCSGFVGQVHQALGMKIPRSSDEMRASKQGARVHDELRYGDVLVYPGHVALYIGNGKTAETVGGTPTGSVSKSTIWRRREVAVRRYFQ